jgi:2-C-methyl-D-erythritol 4-phosphate cytidylyltransferase
MGADVPKQYLDLLGQPILAHTIERLSTHPCVDRVVVAISPADEYWAEVASTLHVQPLVADGGAERALSVLNALEVVAEVAADDDWALVHDAARPCVRAQDIQRLLNTVMQADGHGGILGMSVRDTMKRTAVDGRIVATVARELLWHALTPQVFRVGPLREAIRGALAAGVAVTDEASAMEWSGHQPIVVAGAADNIKITEPQDLQIAEAFLRAQQETQACE